MQKPTVTVVEQGPILSQQDFLRLDIVDWKRSSPYWERPQQAMDTLSRWFIKTSVYHIIQTPLWSYPQRDDFPEWHHVGNAHTDLARAFWNHFHYRFPHAELNFDDSPDFWGEIVYSTGERVNVVGDIGKVSPIGLREGIQKLDESSLWISVVDLNTIILIEPRCSLSKLENAEYLRSINHMVDLRPEG